MTPQTDFPALIRQRRTDLGLTQAAAAAAGGVEATVWSRVERGQSTQLTLKCALGMLKGVGYHATLTIDDNAEPDDTLFSI